jgi:hypothetical protein
MHEESRNHPGPRLWDLAYTAYRYVPLAPHRDDPLQDGASWSRTHFLPDEQQQRIPAFLDAYAGHDAHRRYAASLLLGYVSPRLLAIATWCSGQADADLRSNGATYRADARWLAAGALGRVEAVRVRNA